MFKVPEQYRVKHPFGSGDATNGAFLIPAGAKRNLGLAVIASDGEGWEHVSVSTAMRCPTWEEMCFVKNLFWDEEDMVMQYHPPKSLYVNVHPYCLHMWRPTNGAVVPVPPEWMVG